MKCHGENNDTHKHSPLKHMLHMIICCGLPIVILLLLPFIAGISPRTAGILGLVAPFICPIMMFGMMGMMIFHNKKSGSNCHNENVVIKDTKDIENHE